MDDAMHLEGNSVTAMATPAAGDHERLPTEATVAPPCFVVGLGASAGGQGPLEEIFTAIPTDCGIAFVVVMHLPPEAPHFLADMLGRLTPMPVVTVEDGMPLEANRVHVIPPGNDLILTEGVIRLVEPEPRTIPHPVDRLFRSLAEEKGEQAVAVVLSGYGIDGTDGVKAVRESGGIVIVQEPASALTPAMPNSAIATGMADFILPAGDIPAKIAEIARGHCTLSPRACQVSSLDEELAAIFDIVKQQTGNDFSSYKRNTVIRRIERRMAVHEVGGIGKYIAFLKKNPQEASVLAQDILIGVTSFFRDPEAFETLRTLVIPRICTGRKADEPVRIWHACCASGEEVYSMAILIQEYLNEHQLNLPVQFFATDIDETAITQARAGIYGDDIEAEVGTQRLKTFFTRTNGHWQVSKQLREMVVFAHHSVIKDPPFSRLDLLVCRNFLIYLNPDMQKRLVHLFHMVLKPGAVLFLGTSETVGRNSDLFAPMDKKWKLFERLEGGHRDETILPFAASVRRFSGITRQHKPSGQGEPDPGILAERLLMQRYAPPCVVVNDKYEVVHVSTRMGRFLEVPVGQPTRDILKMALEELRPTLRAAIYKAFSEGKPVAFRGVKLASDGMESVINVLAEPLTTPAAETLAMVFLEQVAAPAPELPTLQEGQPGDEAAREQLVRQLEEQLRVTHEQLQAVSEQLETSHDGFMSANEELMSINEEFQSANEELQSTNEELETSKEELQALNEELVTVNAELHGKVEELNQATSDMENLLSSSDIATLFLDRKFTIKRFTPAMAKILNLIAADVGRPFRHLAGTINWPELTIDATRVLTDLSPIKREVAGIGSELSYLMRLLPYRTANGSIDGVVITLVDITERKRAEEAQARLAAIVNSSDDAILAKDLNGIIHTWNAGAQRIYGYGPDEVIGRPITMLIPPELHVEEEEILRRIADGQQIEHYETVRLTRDGRRIDVSLTASPLRDNEGKIIWVSTIARGITERKRAERERELTLEFLRMVNGRTTTRDLLKTAIDFFQEKSGCEAIGVRLKEGDDFPYFESKGFPDEFLQLESELCRRNAAGDIICDTAGNPALDCMCGNVICQHFDPDKPFFTPKGSFWTNCTTDLFSPASVAALQTSIRNRCNYEGYESVALIPLYFAGERIGLLQLNDRHTGMFTTERIAIWEQLTDYLAVALAKFRTEDKLRKSEQRNEFLAKVLEAASQPFAVGYPDGRLGLVNGAFERLTGYSADELHSIDWVTTLTPPEWLEIERCQLEQLNHSGQPIRYEKEYLRKNGSRVPIELLVHLALDAEGQPAYYYAFVTDISERKRAENALRESELRVRRKLDSIISPDGDIGNLDLADIIDTQALQAIVDDFYELAGVPMGLIDNNGAILVGVGWQPICTEFHRSHPETAKKCLESDTILSAGIPTGEYKMYKCTNNMWDVATPIMVGERHFGNLFIGQFFFEDEQPDYGFYRAQARQYGFDEQSYLAALEKVPRMSRERLDKGMSFFMKLADILSKQSYSNLKLARSLAEREALTDTLSASNEELTRFNNVSVGRELRMIELKKEINTFCEQTGKPPRYSLDFEDEG